MHKLRNTGNKEVAERSQMIRKGLAGVFTGGKEAGAAGGGGEGSRGQWRLEIRQRNLNVIWKAALYKWIDSQRENFPKALFFSIPQLGPFD